jgi:trehalose 6-phosphate synthase/phosphatase
MTPPDSTPFNGPFINRVLIDMFRALQKFDLPQDHVYSVTVGASSKQTDASWHLLEPADVISALQMLNSNSHQDH